MGPSCGSRDPMQRLILCIQTPLQGWTVNHARARKQFHKFLVDGLFEKYPEFLEIRWSTNVVGRKHYHNYIILQQNMRSAISPTCNIRFELTYIYYISTYYLYIYICSIKIMHGTRSFCTNHQPSKLVSHKIDFSQGSQAVITAL